LVVEHVEGFAADYAQTVRHWARRFDERFDDAVRIAGAERARVWRLYLHAAGTASTMLTKMAKAGEIVKAERGYSLPQ
jgi:cyclopropane fatty-acyl-phospholipid synthase-like methyltransferase